MPHDIIDNQSVRLIDTIKNILPQSISARIAVGYFFLSGLDAIAPSLFNVKEIRLLIGSYTSAVTIEQIAEGTRRLNEAKDRFEDVIHPKEIQKNHLVDQTSINIGEVASAMTQTDQNQDMVKSLVGLIEEGRLKVRVYTKGHLHAKAYIFDYGPHFDAKGHPLPRDEKGIAIVGSSNLTLSGLTHNSELNVKIMGDANHEELSRWFERLWEESKDFEPQLMNELRQSWALAQVTPYEVYLKALYEFVHDRLADDTKAEFLWQSEITAALTDFQQNAVRRAVQIIRQYGGTFISDVVGLGKSYIGAAIIKHFERHDRSRSLIICPQSLVRMWEHYNEAYQLNANVLSMGMLKYDAENPDYNILLDDERYANRDFILIDESHNFRNTDVQKYQILQAYLQSSIDRRCVLLTATPRSRNIWDIYNQIKLFHADERTQIPINPPILREFAKKVETGECKASSLLSNIMVRRTRMDVLRWYGYDVDTHKRIDPFNFEPYHIGEKRAYILVGGKPQFFPKRHLQTIEYNIEDTYSGLYDRLLLHIGRPGEHPTGHPDQLMYTRYGLWNYVKGEYQQKSPYNELQRAGINLRGLVRVSLFKRFESSVAAFRITLGRMIASHKAFMTAMSEGMIPAGKDAALLLSEADEYSEPDLIDALEIVLGKDEKKYKIEDFEADRLYQDIGHDLDILQQMQDYVLPITPEDDDKLIVLRNWLTTSQEGHPPLASKKCIVFTQYADTVKYLYDNLNDVLPEGVDLIFGQEKDKSLTAYRFSPHANQNMKPKATYPEINLLFATDVMSEGLNLQDSDQIINYDLHWNPVRLIQRFGRIDRIGTEHSILFGYNFLPEKALEVGLGLKEKLTKRISEIQNMLGGDAAILDPTEKFIDQAFIAIYEGESIDKYETADEDEELVDLTEAEEYMRQLRLENPELFEKIANLRDGIRASHATEAGKVYTVCRAGEYRQIYSIDENDEVKTEDVPTALGKMKCDPSAPLGSPPLKLNEKVVAIQKTFEHHVEEWHAQKRVSLSLTLAQRYVLNELERLRSQTENIDLQAQIELYENVFRQPIIQAVKQELNGIRRNQITDFALMDLLERIYIRHKMHQRAEKFENEQSSQSIPIVVCSLANVN